MRYYAFTIIFPLLLLFRSNRQDDQNLSLTSAPASTLYERLRLSPEDAATRTGVLSLENGGKSLVTRLWLFREAQRTIDIQYFSFARTITGLIACDYVVKAAERGVKVRLLIDETAGKMNAREVKMLDLHDNIEVRVYNAGLKLGRMDKKVKYLVKNRNRMMRRMHNKSMTVDGEIAIVGGRNMSDEYFDFSESYNFRDRDVLLAGKAAGQVAASFEKYWNDPLTVTCRELVGESKKEFSVEALFEKLHRFAADTNYFSPRMRELVDSFPAAFSKHRESGAFLWERHVAFIADVPGKNEHKEKRKGGICEDSIINLIKNARESIDIQTPYFITTEEARKLLNETVRRGVQVRVLTNSMASIDNDIAFSPYKRDRAANLETGIALFEYRPDAAIRFRLMLPEVQHRTQYDGLFGFHAKTILIDGRITVIGSYNLEPRSANLNTECFAVIRSQAFAKTVSRYFEEEFLPENSWRITPAFNPDSKASYKKRAKTAAGNVIPKGLL